MQLSNNLLIYSYPSCSTCRKAVNWLKSKNISYEIINIVETPPPRSILEKALNSFDNRKSLFNTSGISYRKIGANVVNKMSNKDVLDALSLDGKLIKRPFLLFKGKYTLTGFNIEKWEAFFKEIL